MNMSHTTVSCCVSSNEGIRRVKILTDVVDSVAVVAESEDVATAADTADAVETAGVVEPVDVVVVVAAPAAVSVHGRD